MPSNLSKLAHLLPANAASVKPRGDSDQFSAGGLVDDSGFNDEFLEQLDFENAYRELATEQDEDGTSASPMQTAKSINSILKLNNNRAEPVRSSPLEKRRRVLPGIGPSSSSGFVPGDEFDLDLNLVDPAEQQLDIRAMEKALAKKVRIWRDVKTFNLFCLS